MASGIFEAYLSGGAREFFRGHFASAADRRAAVAGATRPLAREVAAALEAQNARLGPSPARNGHLAALSRGAAAVVTGQQVGLFLGPLYTVYKAASAIRVARALAEESGRPVVPVFWLQTEDHDLPEIDRCHVPCAGPDPLKLAVGAPAERISVAHRPLPDDVSLAIDRLRGQLGHLPHVRAHVARLERHYRPGAGWGEAFAGLLAELFADEGLVFIDPRDPALAGAAAPIHRRALIEARPLAESLAAQSRRLEAAGFASTVHVREGSPLSFFHPEGPRGPRFRLAASAGGFAEVGGMRTHALAELLAALEAEPPCFSTSALLRPILQDSLLPVAAYVGGPAEVAYFAQLAPLYDAYGIDMPLVVPRARLRIVEDSTARSLARLGLSADDVLRPEDEILSMVAAARSPESGRAEVADALLAPFDDALRELRGRTEHAAPDTAAAFDKTRAAVKSAVLKLAGKIEKARLGRDQALVAEVRRWKAFLHPNGEPQERVYGLSYFAARHGERALIEQVLAAIAPFDPVPRDLRLAALGPARDVASASSGASR